MLTIPPELRPVLVFLLTAGLKDLFALFGTEISGKTTAFTAALVAAAMTFLDSALAALPVDWQPAVTAILTIAAALLSAFGLQRTLKKIARPAAIAPDVLPKPTRR